MDPVSFVNALELPPIPSGRHRKVTVLKDNVAGAAVDCGSMVSFTKNLTGQNKEDVLNSTLLAQLAATKQFDRFADTKKWYDFYSNVLQNIGWVFQSFSFTKYHSSESSFTVSKLVLELLLTLVGDDNALLDVVQKSLAALEKNPSATLTLFSSNSSNQQNANFQIIPCTRDKNGQVNIAFIASHFSASQVGENFLFFSYGSSSIDLMKTADTFTLNEEIYAKVRQKVVEKLGNNAAAFIDNLPI